MRSTIAICLGIGVLGFGVPLPTLGASTAAESPKPPSVAAKPGPGVRLETLLSAELEEASGKEIIVSRVTMPPNTALPKHWHPGEEFGYVLEGSVVLWREGEPERVTKKGDVVRIPLKQIHTAKTRDEGATILVFRVHEKGKPERVLVE